MFCESILTADDDVTVAGGAVVMATELITMGWGGGRDAESDVDAGFFMCAP